MFLVETATQKFEFERNKIAEDVFLALEFLQFYIRFVSGSVKKEKQDSKWRHKFSPLLFKKMSILRKLVELRT